MLRRAPRVTDCKLNNIFVDPSPAYPYPDHRIIHPNVKSLSVSVFGSAPLLFTISHSLRFVSSGMTASPASCSTMRNS
jgi:hypothetical protein